MLSITAIGIESKILCGIFNQNLPPAYAYKSTPGIRQNWSQSKLYRAEPYIVKVLEHSTFLLWKNTLCLRKNAQFLVSGLKDEKLIKCKPTQKLKHTNSILEYFEYFCQMSSKSILIISRYTVSKVCAFFLETQCTCGQKPEPSVGA